MCHWVRTRIPADDLAITFTNQDCPQFDLCDNQRHFAVEVPRRAIACPTLLNAIFALSSRHLSMGERFDPYAADRYQQECLNQLSAIILDSSNLSNDDLLAATILLRTLEEMDGKRRFPQVSCMFTVDANGN